VVSKPVEVKEEEKPATAVSEEAVEKAEETPPLAAEEKTEDTPAAAEESTEAPTTDESSSEDAPAAAEETSEGTEENSGEEAAEEKKEIKVTMYQDILLDDGIILSYSLYLHLCASHIFISVLGLPC
jgi:cytochrome c oxidase subunit 6b